MSLDWVTPEEALPDDGTYVAIYIPGRPWGDSSDPERVFITVAKFKIGLTVEQREALPDNDERKIIYRGEDQWTNNHRGYHWDSFGPGTFFGEEVTHWAPIEIPEQ